MQRNYRNARLAFQIIVVIAVAAAILLLSNGTAGSSVRRDPGHSHGGNLGGPVHWGDGDGRFSTRGHHPCACIRG